MKEFNMKQGRVNDDNSSAGEPVENERDESDILANQDETDIGDVNEDDPLMGAGPTDRFSTAESDDFARGEVDVKDQMDRAGREHDFPNRAHPPRI
ncbi:MAG: hypothetical protein ACXVA9_09090 [Bdellovibrionales bacterium]